ncbi:hypothetical protein BegalDRAFT_1518 [Beggiatoa alba B18LD]|uniref:Uncharacterized protein n=1 Tax=Beggiatoa alba B18LD TaxID=395493 RepID=I3CFK8_9GAMM|nr:hypothetical protein [Beggiatoa alba]EIJ42401.1 hypothetical protein BegalDRAFT_1518 [Beggiatoa alba B18LD]
MKPLIKIILSIGVMTLILLFSLHLLPDESLSPEASAWLAPNTNLPKPEENAYFSLLAFDVPEGQNPHAEGLKKAALISASAEHYLKTGKNTYKNEAADDLLSKITLDNLCQWEKQDCFNVLREKNSDVQALITKYRFLLNRYRDLYQYKHFHDVTLFTIYTPIPKYAQLLRIQNLSHMALVNHIDNGQINEVLTQLQQDFNFYQRLLAESNNLIAKVIAERALAQTLHVYSNLLDIPQLSPEVITAINQIPTLSPAELSLELAMRSEFRAMANQLLLMASVPQAFLTTEEDNLLFQWGEKVLPFKPRATINFEYPRYTRLLPLNTLSYEEGQALIRQQETPLPVATWRWFYNPIGHILSDIAVPDFSIYFLRLQDLTGLIALVKLKAQLRAENITVKQFSTVNSPYKIHPYTKGVAQIAGEPPFITYAIMAYQRKNPEPTYLSHLYLGKWFFTD